MSHAEAVQNFHLGGAVAKRAPTSVEELGGLLMLVHDHIHQVRGWTMNTEGYFEIVKDYGGDDIPEFYLEARHGRKHFLHHELFRRYVDSVGGFPPTAQEIALIWENCNQNRGRV